MNSSAWASLLARTMSRLLASGRPYAMFCGNGGVEQHRILQDEAHLLPERLQRVVPHVLAVDLHRAAEHVVQPRNECDERRLAAAGRADERRALVRLHEEGGVFQHRFRRPVAERHPVEDDSSRETGRRRGRPDARSPDVRPTTVPRSARTPRTPSRTCRMFSTDP